MTSEAVATTRAEEFFRHHDAKDIEYVRAIVAEGAQFVDEISRTWFRGRAAFEAYLAENFPRVEDMRSNVEEYAIVRWGELEGETFMLRQHYVLDGTAYDIEAPTTLLWRRDGDAWKLALIHSIPLAPAS